MTVGETLQIGPYTVRASIRIDNPAFPAYLVYRNDRLIGRSFSMPDLDCCQWLERTGGSFGSAATVKLKPAAPLRGVAKAGRRRKAAFTDSEEALTET